MTYKLAYLGLPLGALALLRDGLDLRIVGISRPDFPGMRRLRKLMAERGGLLLARPDLEAVSVRELLASTNAQLLVSWFWTRKIPAEVISLYHDSFGIHPSLLPRHRGPDPYFWTLANLDDQTGVTAHTLAEDYDTGSVLAQSSMRVPPECDAWRLARLLDRPSLMLLREVAARFASGKAPTCIAQDEAKATQAPVPSDDDCEILWDWPVDQVLARIRAASPEPGAFTGFGDDTVVIRRARRARSVPAVLNPGEIARTPEGIVIRAADGGIVVLAAKNEEQDTVLAGESVRTVFPGIPVLGS